jgi:hypothetical protein
MKKPSETVNLLVVLKNGPTNVDDIEVKLLNLPPYTFLNLLQFPSYYLGSKQEGKLMQDW